TRRACRAMREALHRRSGAKAILLPSIRPLGDVDEDEALLSPDTGLATDAALALDLPRAITGLERRLILTELVLKWMQASGMSSEAVTDADGEQMYGVTYSARAHHAARLAGELARLMDAVDNEQADLSGLTSLAPDRFAEHWQRTLTFLAIITEEWPKLLEERGALAPYVRRNRLMQAETRRLAASPPEGPVIAEGSTGTVPATAELLETVARLEQGAVVLPGLDLELDEDSWQSLTRDGGHPEHPQYGLKLLLDRMGLERADVAVLDGDGDGARARLASEIMRPSGTTGRWSRLGGGEIARAIEGVVRVDAANEHEEAEAVALMLRAAAEDPGMTAALVTPDRTLARRVCARLATWELSIDDSAGRPLSATPPGVFFDHIIEAAAHDSPVAALSLLKHPFTRLGRAPGTIRRAVRRIELAVWRQPGVPPGLHGLSAAVGRAELRAGADEHVPRPLRRLRPGDWEEMRMLADDADRAFAPLRALTGAAATAAFAAAHIQVAEALARDEDGRADTLWAGEPGEALARFFAELAQHVDDGPEISASDYPELYRTLVAGLAARPRREAHPRLFIWGQLEARLQQPDAVILAGLNEGTWPRAEDSDAWLNRAMRDAVGLSAPERRIGLAAHDFAQLLGAVQVFLVRSGKQDGAPTVPSRWLQRLDAVLEAAGTKPLSAASWTAWARARDLADPIPKAERPSPCPPVESRPRKLSVTRIEKWIANPYDIFARNILGLSPVEEIAGAPDARLRGHVIHEALNRFARRFSTALPNDVAGELMREAGALFAEFGGHAGVRAFWEPQFARFAEWFAATEPERRAGITHVHSELNGEMAVGDSFTLTARADRIDMGGDGRVSIYDYKTGAPPRKSDLEQLRAPQLPLEAAIVAAGGFESLGPAQVARLAHIRVLGSGEDGEQTDAPGDPSALAEETLGKLRELVTTYDNPAQPYEALRRKRFNYRFDDYAHLARLDEWLDETGEGED
ncbi:MAG: double-strand break repair protein AddB, partial [Pseudomonadota bacterium]|nr:double-strand break repair protein AddB [Pseudomonadota bacterium]